MLRWSGNDLQVVDLTRADLERIILAAEPVVESWRAEAVTILGDGRILRPAHHRPARRRTAARS